MPSPGPKHLFSHAVQILITVLLIVNGANSAGNAGETSDAMRLLKKNCLSCHNDDKKKGGLTMATREGLLEGGENGAALVTGNPEESPLITSLSAGADPHMPPKKQLSPAQIELLRRWVTQGAEWDAKALASPASGPRTVNLAALPPSYHPVLAITLSPDSSLLAVAYGNEVRIYEVLKEKPALVCRGSVHPDPVQSITWSPDGRRLATGAFRRVVVWSSESLAVEREITSGLTDRIAALRFLPDGKRLLLADGTVAEEGTVRIVDLEADSPPVSWIAHNDTIFDLAISGDGKLLATAGGDKLVKIWELESQKEIARLEGHAAQVLTLGFNADATQLVTGGADQQIKLWDVKTKEQIGTLGRHTAAINAITWAPAIPAVLAVTDTGSLLRYTEFKSHSGAQSSESAQERKLGTAGTTLYCITGAPNGERVFAGSHDGQLFAWNKDGKLVSKLDFNEDKTTASNAK